MRRFIFLFLLIVGTINSSFGQHAIKIHVEKLKPPTDTLPEKSYRYTLKDIVYETNKLNTRKYKDSINLHVGKLVTHKLLSDSYQYNFIAQSNLNKPLVIGTAHAFYDAMFEAYAHHRSFVLSPDMIWLLIVQGFGQHINNNAEKLRHYFVQHNGKVSLVITSRTIDINNPTAPWEEEAFPSFTDSIGHYTGKELINVLTNNFSTSTPTSIAASQITAMESMRAYFEYVVMMIGCGIPDITLQGTPQDWEKVRKKAQYLKRYDLSWWIDSIDHILKKFVLASKGERDTTFWQNMFKYKKGKPRCGGALTVSNGWIVKFFPYDKEGHRLNLDSISSSEQLPPEVINVPLKYEIVNSDGSVKNINLELWAGFVGSRQDKKDFTLTPQIGWMIRKKDADNSKKDFINKFNSQYSNDVHPVRLRVNEFPQALLQIPHIKNLELDFTDSIHIPDEIRNLKIDKLQLNGKATLEENVGISKLLPNTELYINREDYTNPENKAFAHKMFSSNNYDFPFVVHTKNFPETLLHLDTVKSFQENGIPGFVFVNGKSPSNFFRTVYTDTVKNLEIDFADSIQIPEEAKKINPIILYLNGKISAKEQRRITLLFPHTMLFINGNLLASGNVVRNYFQMNKAPNFKIANFPKQFFQLDSIKSLSLNFTDSIQIPNKIKMVKIGELYMSGKITKERESRVFELLSNTVLNFNNLLYAQSVTKDYLIKHSTQNTNGGYNVNLMFVSDFPNALLQFDRIDYLSLIFADSIHMPDATKNVKIYKLFLQGKITDEEMKRVAHLLPQTELYFNGKRYNH